MHYYTGLQPVDRVLIRVLIQDPGILGVSFCPDLAQRGHKQPAFH
jgi:hypothetical protein